MVQVLFRHRIANVKKAKRSNRPKWDVGKLKDENVRKSFQLTVAEQIERREHDIDFKPVEVESRWKAIKESVVQAAKEVVGEKRGDRNDWFDEDCFHALSLKNNARAKKIQRETRGNTQAYNDLRRKANTVLRRKQRANTNKKLEETEKLAVENESRNLYRNVRWFQKGFQPRADGCKDKDGRIIEDEGEVMERWSEHFRELLNKDTHSESPAEAFFGPQPQIDEPSLNEVQNAIKKLKNNKSSGSDGIVAEFLKNGGERLTESLHALILLIWNQEKMPEEWCTSLVFPIHKKGDKMECQNYRGISLLAVTYKVLSLILLERIKGYAEEALGVYQCGFRQNKSTTDQIFILRQAAEKFVEHDTELYLLFIDYQQAFDSLSRRGVMDALRKDGVPEKLVRLIDTTLRGSMSQVLIGNKVGEPFTMNSGVRQGDSLSATLFNLALNEAVKGIDKKGTAIDKSWQLLAYADDIALMGRSLVALREAFEALNEAGKPLGLKVNEMKTKFLKISPSYRVPRVLQSVAFGPYKFEQVDSFTYLGTSVNSKNRVQDEICSRIMAGNRAFYANIKLFTSRLISRSKS
uniref:Reverse transcriptase domain-containing protein n=2 Tax=Lygus hesperus TaxID=30085 RepID=A0A0A9WMT6_LYGHE